MLLPRKMVRQHFGGWNRPWKIPSLVLKIFNAILLPSSACCTIAYQSVRHPYLLSVNSGAALAMWTDTGKTTCGAHQDLADARLWKITKNQKPAQQRRQSLTCFVVCLLTYLLSSFVTQILRSKLLSVFSCCKLLCCVQGSITYSMFTHHIFFFLPPRI